MSTITKLQIFCFISGLIGGGFYVEELYGFAALCGMAVGVAVGLIYTIAPKKDGTL